ncbi:MAG: mannonate dehydratase [Candidatus Bathyarchaeota archaeon B63]|nr:MAG: mannonate dehydratase [Candidatus Bathyarchaeota archaeon B63]
MVRMRFAVRLPGGVYATSNLILMKQLGCTDVIGSGPRLPPDSEVWEYGDIVQLKMHVEKHGLRLEVLEDGPPIEKIIYNLPGREQQLEDFCKSLENLGKAGIKVIKPQHMPPVPNMIWRTEIDKPTRGGATSTAFDYDLVKDFPPTVKYGEYKEEEIWKNLKYFLEGVIPTAEESGVVITFHPDDPPISPIQGFPRILRSVEAFDKMLNLVPSDNVGICFCQGCFAEMGVDVPSAIRHFGRKGKIFFAHFRNVIGSVHEPGGFQEIFHDDPSGRIDMVEAMKAYYEVGFEGPMRPDHTPKLLLDDIFGGYPGYGMLGKVFALGYMKGLAESVEKMMGLR